MPIELKPVTLNELPLLQEQLPKLQNGDCNLSIASVIGRAKEYNIKWGISQGELVLNWAPYPDIPPAYVIPLRSENALAIIEDIASECQCCKEPVILFGRFTYMTERIALNMNAEGFKVTKTLFDIAWEILSENQKERLMIANLELLNVDDMEKCFGELSGQYSVLSERTKRCKVKLDNTENNRKLVNYLEKIGYITSSWEEKTDSNGQVIIIGCRIKQKR